MATIEMDNDELYKRFPSVHEFALENCEEVNEENYPAVESWLVETNNADEVIGVHKPIFADWYKPKPPMTSLIIREIPKDVADAIKAKAKSVGQSREEWLRDRLIELALGKSSRGQL